MVQRQIVEGLNPLSGNSSRSVQVVQRASQTPVVDPGGSARVQGILNALSEFTDIGSKAAYQQAQIDVANKEVDGMSLAVSGGKLGAEATKAQERGFDLVTSQAELGKINEDLANKIAANPNMTDEEFRSMREGAYSGVFAAYQDKAPEVFKALTIKAQESQVPLYQVQQQAKKKYQLEKGKETLNNNIGSQIDSAQTMEQGTSLIHQFMGQGKEMGLSEFETKDIILDQMKLTASLGDNRLLKFVSATDWGRYTKESKQAKGLYDAYIKQAKAEYEAAQQKANVFAYGAGLAEIENMAKSGASEAELMSKMQNLQGMGLKFSPSSVANYLTMGKTMSASQMQLQSNIGTWQQNRGQFNLATNPYISGDDKNKVLDAAEAAIVQQSSTVPEDQRADFTISNMLRLSQQEGLPVKTITTALSSLANIDPQSQMSPSVATWAKYLMSADDQTIRMNVSDTKDQAFLFGMRDTLINQQGQDADKAFQTAISRGQAVRDNKVPLTKQQTGAIQTQASKSVDSLKDPTQSSFYFFTAGLPSTTKDYLDSQIGAKATQLYQVTHNVKQANDIAVKEFKQNNMILTGGVVANIGVNQLATFVPEFARPGDDQTVVQKRAVSALDYQLDNLIKSQGKEDGIEYKREDVKVIFTNSGNTYQVNVGGLSVGTFFTGDLKNQFNEDFFKKWSETQDKQQGISARSHEIKEVGDTQRKINQMMPKF